MKKIGVLLHGSGVFDGTEIQEAVFTLLAIAEKGGEAVCFAPNINQHHVINHITGEEVNQTRNVLVESARIARGKIVDIADLNTEELDALVMPGGFGTAKNITKWAFNGPTGDIIASVKDLILQFVKSKKPIVGLCMSPTTIAKALENSGLNAKLTVGTINQNSPYEIDAISNGINLLGHKAEMKTIKEVSIDADLKIITAPCYMMEANILDVRQNIKQAVDEMFNMM
ncbi:MAG: isoprenoid biosynthesis glyoxalase ElbB [Ichthyobacteriaceae bacterium]|nr:isoprenoid biosynthesis glyoxalase ElbB [Ichthyobacteriaceae bacterium]